MDIASLVGLLMAAVLVVYGIVAKDGFGAMMGFFDKLSELLTFCGAFMGIMVTEWYIPVFIHRLTYIG